MILNLTQHPASKEQQDAGVIDLQGNELAYLKELLTFDSPPEAGEIQARASDIAMLAISNGIGGDDLDDPIFDRAMIGGVGYLMGPLEQALLEHNIQPLYAFSRRESIEQVQEDGSVRKVAVFRHVCFVEGVAGE